MKKSIDTTVWTWFSRKVRHVCEGDYVATHFEVDGVFGLLPIMEMFKVEDGKITEAIGYFDPRPWHQDRPQRPKVWDSHQVAYIWGPPPTPDFLRRRQ